MAVAYFPFLVNYGQQLLILFVCFTGVHLTLKFNFLNHVVNYLKKRKLSQVEVPEKQEIKKFLTPDQGKSEK